MGDEIMLTNEKNAREALARIAEIAAAVNNGGERDHLETDPYDYNDTADAPGQPEAVCTPKTLPTRLLRKAADTAVHVNPVNAPLLAQMRAGDVTIPDNPLLIAVMTSKYWGPQPRRLTVSFMETTPPDLRSRIVSHLNAWSRRSGVSFVETSTGGQVRISRQGSGYWSYLGTDVLLIPRNRPTMNLQGFTMNTPESEYRRVVRHEAGHTLGFPHEHMRRSLVARIDPPKAYAYFLRTQGWDKQTVDQQVLTPLDERTIMSTPADQTSIMCYQLPGSITRDGRPITGGLDINATDHAFASSIYPKAVPDATIDDEDTWDESEDVELAYSDLRA
jgi:hypothetical protein